MNAVETEQMKNRVSDLIAKQIAPALHMDETGIEVVGIDQGVVQIRLSGACGSCPSSIMAIVHGIEQELRKHLPEVEYLEAVP
jgi:Fe-S cluster biogenesis protein NfuA